MSQETTRRCQALTNSGSQCRRAARPGSDYCQMHRAGAASNGQPGRTAIMSGQDVVAAGNGLPRIEAPVIEDEPSYHQTLAMIRRYVEELKRVAERLEQWRPEWASRIEPPAFVERARRQVFRLLPDPDSGSILGELRRSIQEEGLDREALQGVWVMAQYSIRQQADMLRRRFSGDYETDEWGLDWEFIELVRPLLSFLYGVYWRVETSGLEHIPDYGKVVVAGGPGGASRSPFDSSLIMTAILTDHPSQRLGRSLYPDWLPALPFLAPLAEKLGQVLGHDQNGIRLLEQEEMLIAFPNSLDSLLDRAGVSENIDRHGYVRMALCAGAPIVPAALTRPNSIPTGSGLSSLMTRMPGWSRLSNLPGLDALGMIPPPGKRHLSFGEAIRTDDFQPDAASDILFVSRLAALVDNQIVQMQLQQKR